MQSTTSRRLSGAEIAQFNTQGFLVLRRFVGQDLIAAVRSMVAHSLAPLVGPAEFEADVGYPGAPAGRGEEGGTTPRRLLHAYARGGGSYAKNDFSTGSANYLCVPHVYVV